MKNLAWILIALVILSLVAGCGSKCTKEDYMEKMEPFIDKWDDAIVIAESTSRMSLAPQIENLQEIRRETEDLKISDCADEAHEALIAYMDQTIDAFIAFLGQEDDEKVNRLFSSAQDSMRDWSELVEEIDE